LKCAAMQRKRQLGCRTPKLLWNFLDHFEVDGDVDIVADHDTAAVNAGVPLHAVFLAIDFGGGAGGYARVAPGIFHGIGWSFKVKSNFLGDAVNGEVSVNFEFAGGNVFNFFGFEGDGGYLVTSKNFSLL